MYGRESGRLVLSQIEQLVDIAFAICDVQTAIRIIQQRSRLSHILGPADAFLFVRSALE